MEDLASKVYCFHCRISHSRNVMRLVITKTGKRWSCIQSIVAAKGTKEQREAFDNKMTLANKAYAQRASRMSRSTITKNVK